MTEEDQKGVDAVVDRFGYTHEIIFQAEPTTVSTPFGEELRKLINRFSLEQESNTPDFILAKYMARSLAAWEMTVAERDRWYDINPKPGWNGGRSD